MRFDAWAVMGLFQGQNLITASDWLILRAVMRKEGQNLITHSDWSTGSIVINNGSHFALTSNFHSSITHKE